MKNEQLSAATLEELETLKANYLRRYPQCGYGTWFRKPVETATGWTIEVSRYTSCD